jgi:hypothetical protein
MADEVVVTNETSDPVPVKAVDGPLPVRVVNDFRAQNAFQVCQEQDLEPASDVLFNFEIPDGKRLVIELFTAQILVPAGEGARLRLMTQLDGTASTIDLALTSQGELGGRVEVLVATHAIRAYADNDPSGDGDFHVNINRDNEETPGRALVCVSGYLVD